MVLSLVAVMLGLRGMILVSRSISDPVCEVVDAMAEIEHGRIGTFVDVYERSEIGRLQSGFNRMVAGLSERDRLRDLFGRHVGADVARRALEKGASLSGDVGEAAVLFVDLVGSTALAANRAPDEVAGVLNDFFRIVVGAVDEHHGMINKFQGDAALAVFGAPLRVGGAASAALATARALGTRLRQLPVVDFGIGVSGGPVFAGNIGAENRYEYTVIGDPSTKPRGWPISPKPWSDGCCVRMRPSLVPMTPSSSTGRHAVPACCVAVRTSRTSRRRQTADYVCIVCV